MFNTYHCGQLASSRTISHQKTMSGQRKLIKIPHESLSSKNYDTIENNNKVLSDVTELASFHHLHTPNFTSPSKQPSSHQKVQKLMLNNDMLEMKLRQKDNEIVSLKKTNEEQKSRVSALDEKVLKLK